MRKIQEKYCRQMKGFDYLDWIRKNIHPRLGSSDMISKSSVILKSLVDHLCGEKPGGHFVQALAREDYKEALARADYENVLLVHLYFIFIINKVPITLIEYEKERRNK